MNVCARDIYGVIFYSGGERVTPVVASNRSRDVMASSSTVADSDADDVLSFGGGGSVRDGREDGGRCGDIGEGGDIIHDLMDEGMCERRMWSNIFRRW